jgi:Novel STAND NTPase 1
MNVENNPYPGLRRFEETDADNFFGRDEDIQASSAVAPYRA